jgi:hypothetical protein
VVLTLRVHQEEGGYEYAADHSGGENSKSGTEEAHIEPAVLYQPLGEASEVGSFGEEWRRVFIEYGSRCEQYGGHWQGHRCVGIPGHKKDNKGTCSTIAAAVEAPFMWMPLSYVPFAVSVGSCQIF